jgi:DNA repair exonuclease SbcCD nuclease subunit
VDLLRENAENLLEGIPPEVIIGMMPYPNKAMLVKDQSIDENNFDYGAVFEGLMDVFGLINDKYHCPKILGFHGNVNGARISTGQSVKGHDIIISPLSLMKARADYYPLGHIHLAQDITPTMRYVGCPWNMSWGETDQKYFTVLNLENGLITTEHIPLIAARPMVEVIGEFKDGKFIYENHIPKNAEVRFKYTIIENEKNLITDEQEAELKKAFGDDVRIDPTVIPVQRESRSEDIMSARTTLDEVREYAKVTGEEITRSIEKKIAEIQDVEGI